MSNEINLSVQMNVANLGYAATWSETDSYTQNAVGASSGVQSVTTSMTNLTLGSVTTNGYCVMKNLDLVNVVDFGVNNSGTFVACGTLNPGEVALFRYKSGAVPALKSVVGTNNVQFILLQN